MSKTNANPKSPLGAGERERPQRGSAGLEMKHAMAEMMARCSCRSEMMMEMAGLVGGCGPSTPAEPTRETQ